jgi:hypothetical protein
MRSRSFTIFVTDRQDHAQVDGRRLATGDDLRALLVDVDLQPVDLALVRADRIHQAHVLVLLQRVDRTGHLLLDEATHRQHAAADRLHLGIELLRRMVAHRLLSRAGAVIRTGR